MWWGIADLILPVLCRYYNVAHTQRLAKKQPTRTRTHQQVRRSLMPRPGLQFWKAQPKPHFSNNVRRTLKVHLDVHLLSSIKSSCHWVPLETPRLQATFSLWVAITHLSSGVIQWHYVYFLGLQNCAGFSHLRYRTCSSSDSDYYLHYCRRHILHPTLRSSSWQASRNFWHPRSTRPIVYCALGRSQRWRWGLERVLGQSWAHLAGTWWKVVWCWVRGWCRWNHQGADAEGKKGGAVIWGHLVSKSYQGRSARGEVANGIHRFYT